MKTIRSPKRKSEISKIWVESQSDLEGEFSNTIFFKDCVPVQKLLQGKYNEVTNIAEPLCVMSSSDSDQDLNDIKECVFDKKTCQQKI